MSDPRYTDDELARYFADPAARHAGRAGATPSGNGDGVAPASEDDALLRTFGPAATPPAPTRPAPTRGDGARSDAPVQRPAARPAPPPRPPAPGDDVRRRANVFLKYALIAVGAGAAAVVLILLWLARDLPSLEQIENPRNMLATVVFTADDEELARYYAEENRTWVPLDSISEHVVHALVATEDRSFYDHWGVHLRRTLQAPFTILSSRPQGGSTITQQLARNLYREQVGFDRSPTRKLKEILTAVRIERTYTKDEILEFYLNTVPFMYNAYGIESAAQTYFSKPASQLDPGESATLVGMLAANTRYDPLRNPDASRTRRDVVLRNMVGEDYITAGEYQSVASQPIELRFNRYSHEHNLAPHFAEVLRLWFRAWCQRNGYDPYADGLVIRTTIDSRIQLMAQAAVDSVMPGLQAVVDYEWAGGGGLGTDPEAYRRRMERGDVEPFGLWWRRNGRIVDEYIRGSEEYASLVEDGSTREAATAELRENGTFMDSLRALRTRLEVGLVAMDPQDGRVRAWIGGSDFVADKYDHVAQARRQPGSTFKLFAYTAAFDNGFSPNYPMLDAPFAWGDWRPRNSGGGYAGYVPLRSALAASRNVVAARITRELGPGEVKRYAELMGIRSPLEPVRSIALGTNDVNLLEMASAYSTIANYGVYNGPARGPDPLADPLGIAPHVVLAIDRIEDRYGNVIADFDPTGREVLSASTAWTTVDAMRGVVTGGTARSFVPRFPATRGLDLAGKTGTTQESADGWFMLMHPQLVVGSWVGFNDRRITFRSSYWGQGAHTAMLVTGAFVSRVQTGPEAVRLDSERRFDQPENYQPPSGRRARYEGGAGDYFLQRGGAGDDDASDRPARDLLESWRERGEAVVPGTAPTEEERGRIGW